MSLDVYLSISHPFSMVRGPGDEPRISGKPDYDGTLKDWASSKITIKKSYLHQKRKWLATQYGVAKKQPVAEKQPSQTIAEKQFQTPAPMKAPVDQTPAPMKAPADQTPAPMKAPAISCEEAAIPDTGTDAGASNQQHPRALPLLPRRDASSTRL